MQVETAFLSAYTLPNLSFDDEGFHIVGSLVRRVEDALYGRSDVSVISHGNSLSLYFKFAIEPVRSAARETLLMHAFLGPCDSDRQIAYVTRANSGCF